MLGTWACTPKDADVTPIVYGKTVMEYLRGDARYSTLVSAIDRAGIADAFSRPLSSAAAEGTPGDSITLLAPDNTAFSLAGITDVNAVDANVLRDILLYHVPLAGRSFAATSATTGAIQRNVLNNWVDLTQLAPNGAYLRMRNAVSVVETPTVPTNNTNRIFINRAGSGAINSINGIVRVNFPNIFCNNGIIHGIDRVMMPPSTTVTLYDVISANPNYARFKYAVDKQASLVTDLKNAQLTPRTLLIPTNTAFDNAGITEAFIDANTTAVNGVINYHIVNARSFSTNIANGTIIPTTGYGIIPAASGSDFILNNNPSARITGVTNRAGKIDQLAINGVIHEINAVLTPITSATQTVEQITGANANLNLFPQALTASGLTLTGASIGTVAPTGTPNAPAAFAGAYGVFVPTNQAFIDAGYDQARITAIAAQPAGSADKITLANILRYHVLPNRLFSASASNGLQNSLLWNGVAFLAAGGGAPAGTPNQTNSPSVQNYRQVTVSVSGGIFSVKGASNTEVQAIDATLRNQIGSNGVFHVIPKVLTF